MFLNNKSGNMDPAQALEAREIARHSIINETIARGDSCVQQFYSGAVVLVTGGSGFLGKQLIEKLFRAFYLKKVFVLLRPKRQRTIEERLAKILDDPVYDYLLKTQPDFVENIVPISGDISQPQLGISEKDWKSITDEVTIILHAAATTNFLDPLKKATRTNVLGTRELLRLATKCKNLKSFVHVSTAYAHATEERVSQPILEQIYESPITPDALIDLVEGTDDEGILDIMTPNKLKGWPNTYTFTKAVAEEVVLTVGEDLPVCIVRPAIVICACREPLPGWIDKSTTFGPSGIALGSGLGVLHLFYGDNDTKLDLVPVDIVNNAVIVAAQETAARRQRGESDVKIYTVSNMENPVSFGEIIKTFSTECRNYATMASIWYGYAFAVKNKLLFKVLFWLIHYVPGYIIDGILLLIGRKPILTKVYNKIYKLLDTLGYFTNRTWKLDNSNLRELYHNLSSSDRIIFKCIVDIDWTLLIIIWCIGGRRYIIKDGLKNTKKAVKMQCLFRILNYFFVAGYVLLIYKLLFIILSIASYYFCK